MAAYVVRRLLLMVPTLFGIMLVSFIIVQFAPGGPIERVVAALQGLDRGATARFGGSVGDIGALQQNAAQGALGAQGAQGGALQSAGASFNTHGLDPKFIADLQRQFGFDKPPLERFLMMVANYARFDFGRSYFRDVSVLALMAEKMPVSISLGLWMTLLSYLISIPLGIAKAVHDGAAFDVWTSALVIIGYAIPSFLFAVLLVVLFAGGSFFHVFPLRGLHSDGYQSLPLLMQIADYAWHLVLPVSALALGSFATITFLTKNAFLDEMGKTYVQTARMKGACPQRVLYGHVFRNAMLIVIAGFPGAFISAFFTGSLLIETIFSLDGLGLLSYESLINRDYPVVFATLYIFALLGLIVNLISDITYALVDPRIDFARRDV